MADPIDSLPQSTFEVENWLAKFLTSVPDVVAIAGNDVFPSYLPDGDTPPGITYERTNTARGMTQRGASGLAKASFEVICIGIYGQAGYKQVLSLARAVRLAINGLRRNDLDQYLQNVEVANEFDRKEAALFADGTAGVFHQRVLSVQIDFSEEVKRLIQDAAAESTP
jgi:hypothetical protein